MKLYVGLSTSSEVEKRNTLKLQRHWADLCQEAANSKFVQSDSIIFSRTHSRGMAGAVVSDETRNIGIDIEYQASNRNWPEILSVFSDYTDLSAASTPSLCLAWTFIEAYYKAFQRYPAPSLVLDVISESDLDIPIPIPSCKGWRFHRQLDNDFSLSIVWTGPKTQPQILPILKS